MGVYYNSTERFSSSVLRQPCRTSRWRFHPRTQPVRQYPRRTRWRHQEKKISWMSWHADRHRFCHTFSWAVNPQLCMSPTSQTEPKENYHCQPSAIHSVHRNPSPSHVPWCSCFQTQTTRLSDCPTVHSFQPDTPPDTPDSSWTFHSDTSRHVNHTIYARWLVQKSPRYPSIQCLCWDPPFLSHRHRNTLQVLVTKAGRSYCLNHLYS